MRESQRACVERGGAEEVGEGETDSLMTGEPDTGLDPRTLGSGPEQKADAYPAEPLQSP